MEKKLKELRYLDSTTFISMVEMGMLCLKKHFEEVNDLNVFPVPDGDTGTNMRRTLETGFDVIKNEQGQPLYKVAQDLSKGMLLGARGNSGVILSQIFRGFSAGLYTKKVVSLPGLSYAFRSAVKQAYEAVVKPVEGTILTVIKEAVNQANKLFNAPIYLYFKTLFDTAQETLPKTKEMLDVLKEADVVDSGGAGLTYIFQGFVDYFEEKNYTADDSSLFNLKDTNDKEEKSTSLDFSLFNENSVLDYGYCTEFILQLTKKKVQDIDNFRESTVIDYLKTIGDSIVCLKDGSVVKAHVHTKDPGTVFHHVQQWGEFLTMKCENMSLQHNNVEEHKSKLVEQKKQKEHKKYASVAVAQGDGITEAFLEIGVDKVVSGQQTMNPSSEDFIKVFDELDAENIFVLPNNSNIILTAEQAANMYMEANPNINVIVIKTKSIAQGYVAASMFVFDSDDVNAIVNDVYSSIKDVFSLEITTATRNTTVSGVKVTKGHYIGILNHELVDDNKKKIKCLVESMDKIENVKNKDLILLIYGNDMTEEEKEETRKTVNEQFPSIEIGEISGGQDVYSYIVAIS